MDIVDGVGVGVSSIEDRLQAAKPTTAMKINLVEILAIL